jgi:hypothetical protein
LIEVKMRTAAIVGAAFLAAALLGGADARAFTIQTLNNSNADGSARFVDPDAQAPMQKLTDPSTGRSRSYDYSSPNFSFSITGGSSDNGGNRGTYSGPKTYVDPSEPPAFSHGFGSGPFGPGPR